MNQEIKNIEKVLDDHGKRLYKFISRIINVLGLFTCLYILNLDNLEFNGFMYTFSHLKEYKVQIIIIFAILASSLILKLFIKSFLPSKNVVTDIVEISGYIRQFTETTHLSKGRSVNNNYYYFAEASCSKEIKTVLISDIQNKTIEQLLCNYPPTTIFEFRAAVISPKANAMLDKNLENGCLVLLPIEHYLMSNSWFKKDVKLLQTATDKWQVPKEFNHQPIFTLPRYKNNSNNKNNLVCEDVLHHNDDFIPFQANLKQKQIDLINQFDKPEYEDMEINDVLYYAHEDNENFQDIRVSSKLHSHKIRPNLIGYCFIILVISFYTFNLSLELPEIYSLINQILVSVLILGVIKTLFFPLFISLPVRFHRKNKEVYVYKNGSLYKIPWEECDISILAKQQKSYINYHLTLWLHPQFDMNSKSRKIIPLTLFCSKETHGKTYYFWDYINRYMQYAPEFSLEKKKPLLKAPEMTLTNWLLVAVLLSPLIILILSCLLLVAPDFKWLRNIINPFKTKWPQKVHNWSGKIFNWH